MRSKQNVKHKRSSPKLLPSKWLLVVIVIIIVVGLYLLYPRDFFSSHFEKSVKVSKTGLIYLQQLQKHYSKNDDLQMHEIRHLIGLGHISQAESELAEAGKKELSAKNKEQIIWLHYVLAREKLYRLKEGSEQYKRAKKSLIVKLNDLLALTDTEIEQKLLARDSLALGAVQFSAAMYKKLLHEHPNQPLSIYIAAAKSLRYAKEYKASSQYYFAAKRIAKSVADKEKYFKEGVAVLEEAGSAARALKAANDQIGQLKINVSLAMYLAQVALRANQPADAQRYLSYVLYQKKGNST